MLTRQEMFNRAYLGLKSQGFARCYHDGLCRYTDTVPTEEGNKVIHCAWGWVDPTISEDQDGTVDHLRDQRIGLAAELRPEDSTFARDLQRAHDGNEVQSWGGLARITNSSPDAMQDNLRDLAEHYFLTIPE